MATKLQVGDYVHTGYGADCYPYIVSQVSASGKMVRITPVEWKLKDEYKGKCFGVRITEDMVTDIVPNGEVKTFRMTTRRGVTRLRCRGATLGEGFCYYQDPHF